VTLFVSPSSLAERHNTNPLSLVGRMRTLAGAIEFDVTMDLACDTANSPRKAQQIAVVFSAQLPPMRPIGQTRHVCDAGGRRRPNDVLGDLRFWVTGPLCRRYLEAS
jgi:hypothetical protein